MVSDTEINESTVDNAEPKNDYKKFLLFDDLQEATSESDPDFVLSDDYETISDSSDSQSEVEDLIKDLKKDLKIQGGAELNQEIEKDMENHNQSGRENYLEENSPPSSEFEFVDKNNSSPEPQPSGLQHPLSLENTVSCSPLSFQVKK